MENYVYFAAFIIFIPIIWFILLATNLETKFKPGKIFQIRLAYVLITLIGAHLLASLFAKITTLFGSF